MPQRQTKTERLRALIQEGIDALERGEFIEIDQAELDQLIESLATPTVDRGHAQRNGVDSA